MAISKLYKIKMIFSFWLCTFGIASLFQQANGGWKEDKLVHYASPIIQPIYEVTKKLEDNIAQLEIKRKELEFYKKQLKEKLAKIPEDCRNENLQHHFSFFDKWDFDSCVNLTDDWNIGVDLAMKGAIIGLNVSETLGKIGNNILDCPNLSVLKVLPCYNSNLLKLKATINYFRTENVPFLHNATLVATKMKKDFDHCVGIPVKMQNEIEEHIKIIKC